MADQRQPFRFRLPWMPPTPTPTPTPAPPPRQPAAAPPRPPFRPGGVAPTQPPPRANPPPPPTTTRPNPPPPPRASEQASPPKPASPPKTEPPTKPIASTPSPPKTEPPPKPVASTPLPPKTEPPSKPVASTPSPPKTEPPSKPIASTPSPPKTEPPSKPIASTSSPPKTRPPSSLVSTPKEAKTATSRPISPKQPPTLKSPSGSPSRPKPTSPSSSFPPSPREKTLKEAHDSPKREPSPTLKHPNSPTIVDQGSSSKKEPEKLQAQQQQATIASEIASDNGKSPHSSPKPIQKPVTSIPDKEAPKEVKRVIDESIIKQNGEPRKNLVTEVPESETVLQPVSVERTSYPKVSKPHGNHKPAWEKAPLQKEIKEDISKFVHKLGVGQGKQTPDGEKQLTVITLAGENRGASMTLSNEPRQKESSIHIHRGYRANPDEAIENSTDGEEKNSKADEETTTKAYINSNVQGINNSLLFNGSVSTMNPGVRYVRYNNLKEGSKVRRHDQAGSFEMNKAEFSGTQSEMMAYAPNVRRRCLRGLLMESSDSDPEKPRRHGCRYECKDKNKDVDVL